MIAMSKQRLTRILNACNMPLLKEMTALIEEESSIRIEHDPQTSLVMMKAKDSVSGQPFYLGEVLVTVCTASIDQKFGIGIVIGEQTERAYRMAIVDAAMNAGRPVLEKWGNVLKEEEARIAARRNSECARNAASRVNFNTMGEYDDKR